MANQKPRLQLFNFDAFLRHLESEYAISVATKKLHDGTPLVLVKCYSWVGRATDVLTNRGGGERAHLIDCRAIQWHRRGGGDR